MDGCDTAKGASVELLKFGCQHVVVTLGSKGAVLVSNGGSSRVIEGCHVDRVVDTVGAGDCFCGALAFFLASR